MAGLGRRQTFCWAASALLAGLGARGALPLTQPQGYTPMGAEHLGEARRRGLVSEDQARTLYGFGEH